MLTARGDNIDRITGLELGADDYVPISWEAAFALIARHLLNLSGPNEAEFYTSGRASNEAAYLYQLFVRAFGSNNFPDCSNMCHEASGVALAQSIGVGKGTVTFDDFEHADAIFVLGQNPGTNHPRMLEPLREAVQRGAQVVCVNPLKERGLERFQHPQHPLEMLTNGNLNTADPLALVKALPALIPVKTVLLDSGKIRIEPRRQRPPQRVAPPTRAYRPVAKGSRLR